MSRTLVGGWSGIRWAGALVGTALVLVMLAAPAAGAAERGPAKPVGAHAEAVPQARVVVRFRGSASLERAQGVQGVQGVQGGIEAPLRQARTLGARVGITLADGASVDARTQVVRASGMTSEALAAKLAGDADVEWAVVDRRQRIQAAPNDPKYPAGQATEPVVGQWYLRAPDSTRVAASAFASAWDVTTGSSSVVVAVIDTGVRLTHEDLAGKLLPGYDFVSDVATANDGDGRDGDPGDPGDWVTSAENTTPGGDFEGCGASDSSWHGTQVSGIVAAAADNGLGIAGAGRDIRVLPVRALGKCGGFVSDIAAAMRWAAGLSVPGVPTNANPAQVLNLSLGSANTCDSLYASAISAVTAVGVTVVTAAGNEGLRVNQPGNCSGTIPVAGLRHTGTKVGYSNLGPQVVVAAPAGNCVNTGSGEPCLYALITTSNAGTTTPGADTYTGAFDDATIGTSFASPLVAAAVGLMKSVRADLTPSQITALLKSSSRPFPTTGADAGVQACRAPTAVPQDTECYCTTSTCGAGMLDAEAAVAAAVEAGAAPPTVSIAVGTATPISGSAIALVGTATAPSGTSITTYTWAITSGGDIATLEGSTSNATAQLLATDAGSVTVVFTATTAAGGVASATRTLSIARASGGSSGDSGGGALGALWLAGLAAGTLALRRRA